MKEVTISEAADCLGISIDTVRRRISKGELKARKVPSPHGEIYMVEMPDTPAPLPSDPPEQQQENPAEVGTIDAMRKTISILQTELDARRREVQELHVLLQQAQKQLPPGKIEESTGKTPAKVSWWRRLNPWGK